MKKQHLDFLYEKRFELQARIDELVEARKHPKSSECSGCPDALESELDAARKAIYAVDLIIENYISTHPAPLM